MKIASIEQGYQRKWLQCKECKKVYYYDFVPYSLSNPIMYTDCGHSLGYPRGDLNCKEISADEALILLLKDLKPKG